MRPTDSLSWQDVLDAFPEPARLVTLRRGRQFILVAEGDVLRVVLIYLRRGDWPRLRSESRNSSYVEAIIDAVYVPTSSPVMIDPSLALSTDGIEWIRDAALTGSLIISSAFARSVADGQFDILRGFNSTLSEATLDNAASVLGSLPTFTYSQADGLTERATGIVRSLLESGELGEIYADEWAYLATHSWLLDRLGDSGRAFTRAGAVVYTATDGNLRAFIARARALVPMPLMRVMKVGGSLAKNTWLTAVGGMAIAIVPTLVVPIAVAEAIAATAGGIAGDP
jgi:hypothetical protein